jgi:hypothetical protein
MPPSVLPQRGRSGNPGYTPVKGVDYFDGIDANVTKEAVEAVLTGEISSHSHAALGAIPYAIALS